MSRGLRVLIVEDEVLTLMQLEKYLTTSGHTVVGTALSSCEAEAVATGLQADIAFVDVHLADGPTGTELGRLLTKEMGMAVVFMTANPKRIPDDFSGAIGVIAKPYTQEGLHAALSYLVSAVLDPPPTLKLPRSLALSPSHALAWM